jgi:hypothetical protein
LLISGGRPKKPKTPARWGPCWGLGAHAYKLARTPGVGGTGRRPALVTFEPRAFYICIKQLTLNGGG